DGADRERLRARRLAAIADGIRSRGAEADRDLAGRERGVSHSPRAALVSNKGVFADECEALSEILRRLVKTFDPASIRLLGSRARGTSRPDSDLLMVAKPSGSFGSEDYERVYAPLVGLGVG